MREEDGGERSSESVMWVTASLSKGFLSPKTREQMAGLRGPDPAQAQIPGILVRKRTPILTMYFNAHTSIAQMLCICATQL